MCYRCHKPAVVCVCAHITRVDNRTGVIILQHPRERHHPIGTVRFARLGLGRVEVRECGPRDADSMRRACALPPNTALLYPSDEARLVSDIPAAERPEHIVVVDGTWHQAKTVLRAAPELGALPHIKLAPAAPSQYRIRREPHPDFLSTIEATVAALIALEPDTAGLPGLLDAFGRMVDTQIEAGQRSGSPPPRAHQPRIPRALIQPGPHLVVAYGEMQKGSGAIDTLREPVYWTALKPATGQTFQRFIRPDRVALNPDHLAQMGLARGDIEAGSSAQAFRADWQRFLGPVGVVAAWNRRAIEGVVPQGQALLLKGIAIAILGLPSGHLFEFVAREGLAPRPTPFYGRAAQHMSHTVAVAAHLDAMGQRSA